MKKYRCEVCDYIYDPVLGDPENGIEPGTSFDSLPDEWICPVCGESKPAAEISCKRSPPPVFAIRSDTEHMSGNKKSPRKEDLKKCG